MIKWLVRLVAAPVLMSLHVLEWCAMYIIQYAGMVCKVIAGMIFMLAIIGFVTDLGRGENLLGMLAVGFGFFLIPQLGEIVINCIVFVRSALRYLTK